MNVYFTFLNNNYILTKTFSLKIKKLFIRISLFKFKNYPIRLDCFKEKQKDKQINRDNKINIMHMLYICINFNFSLKSELFFNCLNFSIKNFSIKKLIQILL